MESVHMRLRELLVCTRIWMPSFWCLVGAKEDRQVRWVAYNATTISRGGRKDGGGIEDAREKVGVTDPITETGRVALLIPVMEILGLD